MTEKPFFDFHIFCCTNKREGNNPRGDCASKDAVALRDYMKYRVKELGLKGVRVNNAGCLDRCELGPSFVIYPEGVWYSCKSKEDVEEVIQSHLVSNKKAAHLLMPPS